MKNGIELIAAERQRQKSKEGYTPKHDDEHDGGELARFAAYYTLFDLQSNAMSHWQRFVNFAVPYLVPHDWCGNPKNRIQNLTRAGALIAAEIDRLQRLK